MKKTISILLIALSIICLVSCGLFAPKEKSFEKSGLTITLTENFYEKDQVSYTATYDSSKVAVFTLKEEFSLSSSFSNLSLDEYAKMVIKNNSLTVEAKTKDNLTYFDFEKEINGKNLTYYAFVYKGSDAFWLVQMACESDNVPDCEADIFKYAKSVVVE